MMQSTVPRNTIQNYFSKNEQANGSLKDFNRQNKTPHYQAEELTVIAL